MTHQNIIKAIADQFIAEFMESLGFARKGLVWNRKADSFVDIVVLQKAKFSSPDEATVTLDFSLAVPEFRKMIFGSLPKTFLEADGLFVSRITEILQGTDGGSAMDEWWNLTPINLEESGEVILQALRKSVEPYFAKLRSYGDIREFQERIRGGQTKLPYFLINRALVCWKLGDMPCFEEFLDKAGKWPEQVSRVRNDVRL